MSAAELQGLQDAGRGPARSGSRLGQNEYGRVMEVGASNRQPLRRGTPGEAEPVAPDSGESRELVCISGALRPPIRLSANRLFRSTERVQRSPFDRLDARYHCGGSRRGPGHGAPTRYPYKESCMSNRDGILDSHPSERVKMPPELAAFDRWDADPNDLAKWEAAMAALAPALAPAAGADNSNATVNL